MITADQGVNTEMEVIIHAKLVVVDGVVTIAPSDRGDYHTREHKRGSLVFHDYVFSQTKGVAA